MLAVVLLVAASALAVGLCAEPEVINSAVDRLLEEAKRELGRRGDRLEIEDLLHRFNRTWLGLDWECWLHCRDGWAERVSSAARVGDATLAQDGNRMELRLAMALSQIKVEFQSCTFGVKDFFKATSHFKGHAGEVSLEAAIRLQVNETSKECSASLNRLDIVRTEAVELSTGGNIFHQLRDRFFSRLINHNNSRAARVLSNHLREIVKEYVLMERLCDIFIYHDRTTSPSLQDPTTLSLQDPTTPSLQDPTAPSLLGSTSSKSDKSASTRSCF